MHDKQTILLSVNGERYKMDIDPRERLIDVLRNRLELKGTKEGCGAGDCGACTVLLNGQAINSCLVLALEADGQLVQTIEGLAIDGNLSPIQEAFIQVGASQCGFCTPGMVMTAKSLLDSNPNPTVAEINEAIDGNICRCTGYVKIVEAIELAAKWTGGDRNA